MAYLDIVDEGLRGGVFKPLQHVQILRKLVMMEEI